MLRVLYACLLRLHPPYFRRRYAEEMLWIFDQASGTRAVARLMADAALSLARQWTLRPEFLERPIPSEAGGPALDAVPAFHTFGNSAPRAAALVNGGVVSLVVFGAVFLGMAYGWGHPALSELLPGGKSARHPRAAATRRPAGPAADRTGPKIPESRSAGELKPESAWSSAMGLLGLSPPRRPAVRAKPEAGEAGSRATSSVLPAANAIVSPQVQVQPGAGARSVIAAGIPIPDEPLRPYVGVYVLEPPDGRVIVVTLENGELTAQVGGEKKRVLVAESGTKFVAVGMENRWFEFVTAPGGEVTTVHLFETERKTARRR